MLVYIYLFIISPFNVCVLSSIFYLFFSVLIKCLGYEFFLTVTFYESKKRRCFYYCCIFFYVTKPFFYCKQNHFFLSPKHSFHLPHSYILFCFLNFYPNFFFINALLHSFSVFSLILQKEYRVDRATDRWVGGRLTN